MKQGLSILAILALAAAGLWCSLDNERFPVRLGLDLKGGVRLTLEPDPTKEGGQNVDVATMRLVRDVIDKRVNAFGLAGTDVRLKGDRQVLVLLPGARNPDEAQRILTTVAQLEFRHLADVQSQRDPGARYKMDVRSGDPKKGETDTYTFTDTENADKPVDEKVVIENSQLIVKGNSLKATSRAQLDPNTGNPLVTFEFQPDGARVFGDFTTDHVQEILAIVLDNKIISAPSINEPITNGQGQISGGFKNMVEARVLANLLNSGALPIPLRPAETQTVGATLGQESVDRSIKAAVVGLILVLVFMVAYYWLPGVIACLALCFYAVLTFAVYKGAGVFDPIVLDLPGITGFILSIGMAVDANILIFERLKEELKSGKSLHVAVDTGFRRAFSAILDSNVTTWIVCAILIWLGAPIIKGFAITLAIGVAVSMFTAITVTRSILHLVMEVPAFRSERAFGLGTSWLGTFVPAVRSGAILAVYAQRKVYFGLSILLCVLSLVFIGMTPFGKGLRAGIDFTGGTVIEAAFYEPGITREQVEEAATKAGIEDATISVATSDQTWTKATIELQKVDAASEGAVRDRLYNAANGFDAGKMTVSREGETFKAVAPYTGPVEESAIRSALAAPAGEGEIKLDLTGLKITAEKVDRTASQAVSIALIQSQSIHPDGVARLKEELQKVGGGVVETLYQANSIGPSIASEVTMTAYLSVIAASFFIVAYLAFRFAIGGLVNGLKFGGCAVVALLHDVGITIGLFALMGPLAGWHVDSLFVTAALTVIGFSVHDTIVVYDRIRENLIHKKKTETFADVSDRSITQTFDRSLNTSFTVILVVAAIVFFGGDSVRLFNIALLFGISIGTYSSIFVASPMVVLLEQRLMAAESAAAGRPARKDVTLARKPATEPSLSRPASRPPAEGEAAAVSSDAATARSAASRQKKKRRM